MLSTGAILVFLPGYDEIITLRDQLTADREFGNSKRCCFIELYSDSFMWSFNVTFLGMTGNINGP